MSDFSETKDGIPYGVSQENIYSPVQGLIENTTLVIPGAVCKRWMETGGAICPFCEFPQFILPITGGKVYGPEVFWEMYEAAVTQATDRLTIFNGGSFFPPEEIPLEFQDRVFNDISMRDISMLCVETRPEYFTHDVGARMRRGLGDKSGMIMIGLESTQSNVRNSKKHLAKAMSDKDFTNALDVAQEFDIDVFVYVMLGAPGLTESERVEDTLRTLSILSSISVDEMGLSLAFVGPSARMSDMYHAGEYELPSLWSAVHVLGYSDNHLMPLRFGGFEENPKPIAIATSCVRCEELLKAALAQHRAIGVMGDIPSCSCRDLWSKATGIP